MNTRSSILFFAFLIMLASCKGRNTSSHGPIVMGDSATIVTESDSQYLHDFVADLHPQVAATKPEEETTDDTTAKQTTPVATSSTTPTPTTTPTPVTPPQPAGNGLNVTFKEVSVFIPGITTRPDHNKDLSKANGATYQLTGGNLAGNTIKITQGTITKISQKYETVVLIKNNLGTLTLEDLSNTTDWQPLRGNKNGYAISGLDAAHLSYEKSTPAEIRDAVTKEVRNKRMNRKKQQEWVNSVHNVHSVNQKPMQVVLRSVMWKIEGKDAKGKTFQKQLRVDLPL